MSTTYGLIKSADNQSIEFYNVDDVIEYRINHQWYNGYWIDEQYKKNLNIMKKDNTDLIKVVILKKKNETYKLIGVAIIGLFTIICYLILQQS